MRTTKVIGISLVGLLALSGCGGDEDSEATQETPEPVEVEATAEDTGEATGAVEDPWENIPDDAPINDMESEEDIFRYMFDCDEDETVEECEAGHTDDVNAGMLDYDIESCIELIEEFERDGGAFMDCTSVTIPNSEFYTVFEEREGYPVPEELRADDADLSESTPSGESFDSCEDADMHWGGLQNDKLDGLPVDEEELAGTETWLQENGCW